MDQRFQIDNQYTELCRLLLNQVEWLLANGANPVTLAAVMVGIGSYIMRQSIGAEHTSSLVCEISSELSKFATIEAVGRVSGANGSKQPAGGDFLYD